MVHGPPKYFAPLGKAVFHNKEKFSGVVSKIVCIGMFVIGM